MTVWRLEVRTTSATRHIALEGTDSSPTGDLLDQLQSLGIHDRPVRVGGRNITGVETLGALNLCHGAVLECGVNPASLPDRVEPGHYLVVVAGPDAGRFFLLPLGTTLIGRSESADHTIDDPLLSGCHASLDVGVDGSIVVSDLDSTNGTELEGKPVGSAGTDLFGGSDVEPGSFIQLGSSVMTVLRLTSEDQAVLGEHRGASRSMPRRFRQATDPLPVKLKAPSPPPASEPQPTPWWRSLTPLLTGIGFAVMTGRWQFLLIIALAPVVFTFDIQRQKKRRKEADEEAAKNYQAERRAFDALVADVRSTERTRRRSAAAGGGMACFVASARHRRLWERGSEDEDFGSVHIGLATLPSALDAGDEHPVAGRPGLWGSPLTASLPSTGSLGITGPTNRCRGVLRNLMIGLATSHSPADIRIWLFCDGADHADWEFARWLPHSFSSESTSAVATSEADRAALLSRVQQVIDTRTEETGSDKTGPLHVVVVDGRHLLPDRDLTDLLTRGPGLGVIGIVADEHSVPEGAHGQLRLGSTADDGSFESRLAPLVTDVRIAELHPDVAEQAARSLAGLKPVSDTADDEGSSRLVDLLDLAGVQTSDVVARWEQRSPDSRAVVGTAGDAPFAIDITRHGPHGLVGGMSGSGKTEFLMTFLTSLCLNNHPDDLSIVIVDFKGGVDHALTSQLPHVVGMSTNLHIEQFARTIRLLDAEQRRRQELLAGVGSDLEAYRLARLQRPELPPLPRLLVIVDEFSELLANDEGRERLQELVRVTRIGRALGVHLLLVTQNFEGQLPPQIEANAGLRVCLRVMKPSHSKVVLDSGIAASIGAGEVGRAYARFHGQELTEFQTARVAGQQQHLSPARPPLQAWPLPLTRLTLESPRSERAAAQISRPPSDQTDMSALIPVLWQAAGETGWSGSAMPWPGDLPAELPLAELVAAHEIGRTQAIHFPVAVEDQPGRQRQVALAFSEQDQQMMLIGGASSGVTAAVAAMATSAAILHPPDRLHVHGIDLDGSGLDALRALPHCGTIATRDEPLAFRLLRYLATTVSERRSTLVAAGVQTVWELPPADRPPHLLVLMTGADRLVRRGEESRSQLLAPLLRLLPEAIGTGVQLVLGGLPPLADSRLGSNIERRFVFSIPGDMGPGSYGIPRELAVELATAGRAVDTGSKHLVQFAQLTDGTRPTAPVIKAVASRLATGSSSTWSTTTNTPHRLTTMGWPVPLPMELDPPDHPGAWLPTGFDLDTGTMTWIDGQEDGPLIVVAGASRSGRSTTLLTISRMARDLGWTTLGIAGSRRSPLHDAAVIDHLVDTNQLTHQLSAWLARESSKPNQPLLVVVDDAQRLDPDGFDLSLLTDRQHVIVLAGPIDFMGRRGGLWQKLPEIRTGLLLAPTSALDGSAVGLTGRLPDEVLNASQPGRGLLAVAGEYRQVQMPIAINENRCQAAAAASPGLSGTTDTG